MTYVSNLEFVILDFIKVLDTISTEADRVNSLWDSWKAGDSAYKSPRLHLCPTQSCFDISLSVRLLKYTTLHIATFFKTHYYGRQFAWYPKIYFLNVLDFRTDA